MNQLIAIAGRARSGKDTAAKALLDKGFRRLAFADALKEVTALIADEPRHLYFDDVTKEEFSEALGMTRRQALQKVGSGMRESLGKEVWLTRAIRHWGAQGRPNAVITDCRYENEAQAIHAVGGIIIRLTRPDNVGLTGEAAAHASEIPLPDDLVDVEVLNDGTIGELKAEILKVLDAVGRKS